MMDDEKFDYGAYRRRNDNRRYVLTAVFVVGVVASSYFVRRCDGDYVSVRRSALELIVDE